MQQTYYLYLKEGQLLQKRLEIVASRQHKSISKEGKTFAEAVSFRLKDETFMTKAAKSSGTCKSCNLNLNFIFRQNHLYFFQYYQECSI